MWATFITRRNQTIPRSFRGISISTFQGFLPPPNLAAKIVAPPYDVLDSAEARVLAADNPLSFLHVNKPEIDLPIDCDPYSDIVYATGKANLSKFIANGWLQADSIPRLYVYAITMGNRTQVGVVAGASVQDYSEKRIKVHELTRKKKELDRTKLTDIQGANAGPVFLMYRDQIKIDEIVGKIRSRQAFIDVVAGDGNRHMVGTR